MSNVTPTTSMSSPTESVSNLLNSTVHTPNIKTASSTTTDDKIVNKYSPMILAEGNLKKIEVIEHFRRLTVLRKEAEALEKTDWMYEPVEKLLGK